MSSPEERDPCGTGPEGSGVPRNAGEIRDRLSAAGIAPSRRRGQNFLVDANFLQLIVRTAQIAPGQTVLEVGPGIGNLTAALLDAGARVVAVEIDRKLAAFAQEALGPRDGLRLIHADALGGPGHKSVAPEVLAELGDAGPVKVVSSLPYCVATTFILAAICAERFGPMVVLVQQEVGEKLCAQTGALALAAQTFCEAERVRRAPPQLFWPRPEVESWLIALRPRADAPRIDRAGFLATVRALFAYPRKTLRANVREWQDVAAGEAEQILRSAGVDPELRPETLDCAAALALHRKIEERMSHG